MIRALSISSIALLMILPGAVAETTPQETGPMWDCLPPAYVPLDAHPRIEVCRQVHATCQVWEAPGTEAARAVRPQGFTVAARFVERPGQTLHIDCQGHARIAALNQGTVGGEHRFVDLRLGKAPSDFEPAQPVVEAFGAYTPGTWSLLELDLDFQFSLVLPGVGLASDIKVTGPAQLHNTEGAPQLALTDAVVEFPGWHWDLAVTGAPEVVLRY